MQLLVPFLAGVATALAILLHLRYQSSVPGALALLSIVAALNIQTSRS